MKTRYTGVTLWTDRHGKIRARFRKGGKTIYMKTLPDQPGFEAELAALREAAPRIEDRSIPFSVNAGITRYYRSADWAKGGEDHRRGRRGLLETFRAEVGNDLVANFTFEHIEAILLNKAAKRIDDRGRTVGGQVAAMNLRKQLKRVFAYWKKIGWISSNPVEDAERVGTARIVGRYTWTEADIAQYQARHPLGTKARLFLEILLWTGKRRGDGRLFGPQHAIEGKIRFRAGKTGKDLVLPMPRDLKRAIDAMPSVGIKSFLVTEFGKPFGKAGIGNKMREWCDEAGLPQCTAHGLRKAIARRMAQLRGTEEELMAVGGWRDPSQVRVYTEAVEQEELAEGMIARVDARYSTLRDGENG